MKAHITIDKSITQVSVLKT